MIEWATHKLKIGSPFRFAFYHDSLCGSTSDLVSVSGAHRIPAKCDDKIRIRLSKQNLVKCQELGECFRIDWSLLRIHTHCAHSHGRAFTFADLDELCSSAIFVSTRKLLLTNLSAAHLYPNIDKDSLLHWKHCSGQPYHHFFTLAVHRRIRFYIRQGLCPIAAMSIASHDNKIVIRSHFCTMQTIEFIYFIRCALIKRNANESIGAQYSRRFPVHTQQCCRSSLAQNIWFALFWATLAAIANTIGSFFNMPWMRSTCVWRTLRNCLESEDTHNIQHV